MNESRFRGRSIVVIVATLVVLSGFVGVVAAQSPSAQATVAQTAPAGSVVVAEDETVRGISTVAGTVVVRGTVNGDVNVVAGDLVIAESGHVTGNLNGASGSLRVAGTVDGNVDYAAGSVIFDRTAHVGGTVDMGAGTVVVAGTIDGDATVGADTIRVTPSAVLGGDLRYDAALTLQDGATVQGSVIRDDSIGGGMGSIGWGAGWGIPGWANTVYGFFANLVLGVLLIGLFPRFSTDVADGALDRPLRSGGWGLLALFGIPVVLVAFAITIVGIPIALLGVVLYLLALWIGMVYGEYAVGRLLTSSLGTGSRWAALVLGLFVFAVIGLVPVLGGIAIFLALLIGLGALGATLVGRFRLRRAGDEESTAVR